MQFITFLKTFACVCVCTCNTTPLLKGSNHTDENVRVGGSRDLFLFSNDVKCCSTLHIKEKSNFEGLQTYERHESHLMMQ